MRLTRIVISVLLAGTLSMPAMASSNWVDDFLHRYDPSGNGPSPAQNAPQANLGQFLTTGEVPITMKFVEGAKAYGGQKAYTKQEAMQLFKDAAAVATKPFIYLSAGVSNAEFTESLELAGESGVKFNGVLCGRANWQGGVAEFARAGVDALESWLEAEGIRNVRAVNECLRAATPWSRWFAASLASVGPIKSSVGSAASVAPPSRISAGSVHIGALKQHLFAAVDFEIHVHLVAQLHRALDRRKGGLRAPHLLQRLIDLGLFDRLRRGE